MNDPAVLFYTSDFLTGVIDMTMEERGQYITLLCYQHQKGHIKEETIRLLVGYASVNVMRHFKQDKDGLYYNERMEIETEKRHNFTESRRNNGKKGGRPKKSEEDSKEEQEISDWEEMLNFFDNKCVCCGYQFKNGEKPTKDHIMPKSLGGSDDISNLQPLCRECNASKCADNCNDYRLNYIADIPQKLKQKWFKEKPYGFYMNNLMGNENEDENINKNINNNDNIYSYIESNFNKILSPIEYEIVSQWEDNELTRYAIEEAVLRNAKSLKYVQKILDNWKDSGITTIEQAKTKHIKKQYNQDAYDYNWLEEE